MALYIPHSIFHLARLLYVRPETFGPYYVSRCFMKGIICRHKYVIGFTEVDFNCETTNKDYRVSHTDYLFEHRTVLLEVCLGKIWAN